MDGKLDEGSARLLLDSAPSKVISNEMTVSSPVFFFSSLHLYQSYSCMCTQTELSHLFTYIAIFQVQVKCSLAYMDFEGRSDGRSVKSVIAHVAPLKLVRVFSWNIVSYNICGFDFSVLTYLLPSEHFFVCPCLLSFSWLKIVLNSLQAHVLKHLHY